MKAYHIQPNEMTPAALFEDFHKRAWFRNRISNALMAIALFEVESKSGNLSKYVNDGLAVSDDCSTILEQIAQNHVDYQYPDYTAKVLMDILTNRLVQDPDKSKLDRYRKGFSAAQKVFEMIQKQEQPDEEMVEKTKQVIEEIDTEIESTYASEENLYRGSFIPR